MYQSGIQLVIKPCNEMSAHALRPFYSCSALFPAQQPKPPLPRVCTKHVNNTMVDGYVTLSNISGPTLLPWGSVFFFFSFWVKNFDLTLNMRVWLYPASCQSRVVLFPFLIHAFSSIKMFLWQPVSHSN